MPSKVSTILGLCAVVLVAGSGLVAYQLTRPPRVAIAGATETLSATQAVDGGTEPAAIPDTPVLTNSSSDPSRLNVDFGYKVGNTDYAYRLGIAFAREADQGTMDLGAPRGKTDDLEQFPVTRRWSDSRNAYLVAGSYSLAKVTPAIPSLCVRAVIGPSKANLDLRQASLCVMQRDQDGRCHPTSLACGLIR